jgi:four helix bundle protein
VYALAQEFAREADSLVRRSRCGLSLADHIIRSAESVLLNIAEGSAYYSPGKKLNHYNIARASAAECLAGLDRLSDLNPRLDLRAVRGHARALGVLLTSLIKTQERRRQQ